MAISEKGYAYIARIYRLAMKTVEATCMVGKVSVIVSNRAACDHASHLCAPLLLVTPASNRISFANLKFNHQSNPPLAKQSEKVLLE